MGAARDLMIAVFGEALLVLAIARRRARPPTAPTCSAMSAARGRLAHLGGPTHWCGAIAFALVILVETGRQPIDNPDTHLELTMIHEGPLLEYAGRDLALAAVGGRRAPLGGARARRRAVPARTRARSARVSRLLGRRGRRPCAPRLAVIETHEAKMRMLRVPALLGVGCAIALAGAGLWIGGLGT